MKISEKEQREIIEKGESQKFTLVSKDFFDTEFNYSSAITTLAVCENKRNKKLYGFLFMDESGEFISTTNNELFELSAKPVTKIEYSRKDGKEIF